MALKESGVKLVAQDQAAFLAALAAANGAVNALGVGSAGAAQQIDKLSGRIEFQKRSLGILAQELNATKAKYGEGSVQAQKKQLALDKLTASIARDEAALSRLRAQQTAAASSSAQLASGFDRAGQGASRLGEVMTGALRRAGELAVNLFMRIGQGIADGIGQAVDMAGDYEQAMDVMAAQSGATAEQMEQVRATAKALGADLTLPATSAVDAGNAMLELSKGGLSVEDAMNAAKGTLQLAAAAQTDVATAANITTGALSAFGLEGEQAGYVADLLTNAANKSRASITDLGQGFQQAAFRFRSAGQGADDLAASLTILINKGLSGSDAGTALQNAIARLQGPTDKAAKLMHQLGINVYDANGNMLPMADIIGVLDTAFEGMTQQERNAALQTIFLSDGMKAMIPLLDAGRDGFLRMRDEVNEAGSAQAMAAAQMQGLKGAAAGLQSQVETLALEALEPLLPIMAGVLGRAAEIAGSFVGQVGPAVRDTIGTLERLAGIIEPVLVPALAGLTAATIAYGLASGAAAIGGIQNLGAAIGLVTQRVLANTLAMAAAVAPYALIAVTVGAAVMALQRSRAQIDAQTEAILKNNQAWIAANDAMTRHAATSGEARAALDPYAATITVLQERLKAEYDALELANSSTRATIQQKEELRAKIEQTQLALSQVTEAYNAEEQALYRIQAAGLTATAQTQAQTDALAGNAAQVQLTTEQIDALAKELEETFIGGTQAVQDYVTQAAALMAQLTDENKAANERITADQALAYAEQAAAQRAHLGEMLSNYTLVQRELGNITTQQAGVILSAIEQQFGTTENTAARTFLSMEQAIDEFAANGGASADELAGHLGQLQDDAIATKARMDELSKKYTAELVQNFNEGEIDAEQLRRALEEIPSRVYSEVQVHTRYTQSGDGPDNNRGQYDGFASGGRATAGQTIMVGERGPELFTPREHGYIVPNARISPPASPGQIMASAAAATYNQQRTNVYNYSPTYAQPPRAPAVDFATMAAFGS